MKDNAKRIKKKTKKFLKEWEDEVYEAKENEANLALLWYLAGNHDEVQLILEKYI